MATFHTDSGEEERPLIFDNPELSETMARLRDLIVEQQGTPGDTLVGLREGENGEWLGVFRKP